MAQVLEECCCRSLPSRSGFTESRPGKNPHPSKPAWVGTLFLVLVGGRKTRKRKSLFKPLASQIQYLAAFGLVYCYIASAPILVFHDKSNAAASCPTGAELRA